MLDPHVEGRGSAARLEPQGHGVAIPPKAECAPARHTQRRTHTPFTSTVRQAATTGARRPTTAPRAPAQPARTTPRAQTTALASVVSTVMVAAKASTADATSRNARMFVSLVCCYGSSVEYVLRAHW